MLTFTGDEMPKKAGAHFPNNEPTEFGRLLAKFRQSKGITQKALSNWAGISPEHLCRIESGERPPPRRLVVERVASGLRLSSLEREQLLESSGHPLISSGIGLSSGVREAVEGLLERVAAGVGSGQGRLSKLSPLPVAALDPLYPTVRGVIQTIEAAITLLRVAAGVTPSQSTPIQMTFLGLRDLLDIEPQFRGWCNAAIHGVLQRGWNFQHLWALDEDSQRSLALVKEVLQFLGFPGKYEPYVIHRNALPSGSPTELLMVPGVGALLFLTTTHDAYPDSAMLIRDEQSLSILAEHLRVSLSRAKMLFNVYDGAEERRKFDNDLTTDEEKPGDRFLVKDGLSSLQIPVDIWFSRVCEALTEEGDQRGDPAYYESARDCRRRRYGAFVEQLGDFRFYDISPKSGVQHFARFGEAHRGGWLNYEPRNVRCYNPRERIEILRLLIQRMRDQENYVFALLDGRRDDIARVYWEIKGDHVVFLESWQPTKGRPESGESEREELLLAIREPTVVKAFRAYYLELWEHLPPKSRDKEKVIPWLERQIKWIQERANEG